jgi:SAM-dependent methyltransferase
MTYLDWHDQPGYYRDVTRHFRPDTSILDVGCGSAWLANHFANYVGIDNSPVALQSARAAGRNVLEADLEQRLPFDDDQFEGAVLKDVVEHVRDPVALMREIRRVLKAGGRVFASSPDAQRWVWDDYTHVRPFTRKAYRLLFEDLGFEVERVGYESVAPGTGVVSGWTRRKRRPRLFALLAWMPGVRRNVWILARNPI